MFNQFLILLRNPKQKSRLCQFLIIDIERSLFVEALLFIKSDIKKYESITISAVSVDNCIDCLPKRDIIELHKILGIALSRMNCYKTLNI